MSLDPPSPLLVLVVLCAAAFAPIGCASMPTRQYGVDELRFVGVERLSRAALASCLVTKPRARATLRVGGESVCGEAPFDSQSPALALFAWPWSAWPVFDSAIFEIDRKRILRWYAARGFYNAEITRVRYETDEGAFEPREQCDAGDCKLSIEVAVREGDPVLVRTVALAGDERLTQAQRAQLRGLLESRPGERFDESTYEADKKRLVDWAQENGYAQARVTGKVDVDRVKLGAWLRYGLVLGPVSTFGELRVVGATRVDPRAVIEVAGIRAGSPFKPSVMLDAERAVKALGLFSSVRIEPQITADSGVVDLVMKVSEGRVERLRFGVGMLAGTMRRSTSDETLSIPEWDVHLRGVYTHQDFLGGMRRLTLEERPRVIFLDPFPAVPGVGPKLGNTFTATFEQPRFVEARSVLFVAAEWDYGPSPFLASCDAVAASNTPAQMPQCVVFRHDLQSKVGVRRPFFAQRLMLQFALGHDLYETLGGARTVSNYRLPYLEQQVRVDLRSDAQRPRSGAYAETTVQEAVQPGGYGSFRYVRILPELRAYQPLFFGMVLAERVAFGALFIDQAHTDARLDATSRQVGPETYRLRGGGANSNRGFGPGKLGVGQNGGMRRYEASVELRVPLADSFGLVLFFDVGDVNDEPRVRLRRLNAATGLGLRYFTPFAPIRLDAGWRIPALQAIGNEPPPAHDAEPDAHLHVLPSAVHLTLGEAF